MKKTVIGLAVAALASTAANASVIYQQDGTKIDLDGRLHFEIYNQKDKRTDLRDMGSRLRVSAYQEIGGGFSALGNIELRFSSPTQIGGDTRTHRLFAGFTHPDIGTLTFGRQLHHGDHIPKANYTYEWGGNIFFDGHHKAAHFMSAKFSGFRFSADYYFGNPDKSNNQADTERGYGAGLFYDGNFGENVAFRFGSGYSEVVRSADGTKTTDYKLKRGGVGVDVKFNNFVTVGFDWAFGRAEKGYNAAGLGFQKVFAFSDHAFNKHNRFLAGLKFDVSEKNAVYGQYYFGTAHKADATVAKYKGNGWMIGADHRFNKHVAVYLEGGTGKVKQGGEELKKNHLVTTGFRMLF